MKTYYLKIEARYSVKTEEIDEDGEVTFETHCKTKIYHSKEFSTLADAVDFGNQFIDKNKWLEQYSGYIGQRLKTGFGRPLVGFGLKNGAQVFISIETHDTPEDFEDVLQFLDVERIESIGD